MTVRRHDSPAPRRPGTPTARRNQPPSAKQETQALNAQDMNAHRLYGRHHGPVSLLHQIKAMRRNFALNGSAIIRNHAMRFAALLLALALFHAPLAAQAGQAADADAG